MGIALPSFLIAKDSQVGFLVAAFLMLLVATPIIIYWETRRALEDRGFGFSEADFRALEEELSDEEKVEVPNVIMSLVRFSRINSYRPPARASPKVIEEALGLLEMKAESVAQRVAPHRWDLFWLIQTRALGLELPEGPAMDRFFKDVVLAIDALVKVIIKYSHGDARPWPKELEHIYSLKTIDILVEIKRSLVQNFSFMRYGLYQLGIPE
jgi:hypothetical protein